MSDARTPRAVRALSLPGAGSDARTVLLLVDVAPRSRAWGLQRYVLGAWPLRGTPGLKLCKVLGSGHDGGFGLRPSASRQGLLCVFDTSVQAEDFLQRATIVAEYRHHAREFLAMTLRATSCRGSWSGVTLPVPAGAPPPAGTPVAALTRASIRPRQASAFWKLAPAAQRSLEQAEGCRLAVGLGEAPLLRQATFSVWESVDAMSRYARTGAHQAAIAAAWQHGFFSESMFARFVVEHIDGVWKGRHYPEALVPHAGEPPLFPMPVAVAEAEALDHA
jgi:hypothetical protein